MAETETLKDNPKAITPRWGAIELLQVLSLLMIPFGAFLLPSGWSALPWFVAALFFVIPFFLVRVPEAEAAGRPDAAAKPAPPDTSRRVEAFHSRKYPGVYHICPNCPEGDNIELENRAPGTGGGELCERCDKLVEQGGCG